MTRRAWETRLRDIGGYLVRYGLVVVIAWIGILKFTHSEAMRIQQYIQHSPLMSWMNLVLDPALQSAVFGSIEIIAALLIAVRPWLPRVSAIGSIIGIGLFLTTLSFFVTTPGVGDPAAGGFPALSPVGQFLLKDLVLLGASVWTLGDALAGVRSRKLEP